MYMKYQSVQFKKAIFDEDTVKQLIDLSYIWEKEENTWGLRHNDKSDLGKVCYIAVLDNKIIGYIFGDYSINETHQSFAKKGDKFFDVAELYVLPEYRNQGIGQKLFNLIEEEAQKEADFIVLGTATKDYRRILKFYLENVDMSFHSAFLFKKTKR